VADRVGVMNAGRLDQIAPPTELYARPATRFVAEFVGTSNLISGAVAEGLLGTPQAVSVRPEKITVQPRGGSPAAQDGVVRVDGVVREVVYAGPATRVVVDVEPDLTLAALILNVEAGAARFTRGQSVTLSWDAAASRQVDSSVEKENP
jgi:putative spermidine/putrescine transport system ATP-binding protein